MVTLRKTSEVARDLKWSPMKLLITAALITGITGMFLPEILGLGIEHIENILNDGFLCIICFPSHWQINYY